MKDMINLGLRLMIVSLLSGLLLGVTNMVTTGPIAEQNAAKANAARLAVMPTGGDFQTIDAPFDGIDGAYVNNDGYVFEITGSGYGSGGIGVTVGIYNDGSISGVQLDVSGETPGLGTKAGNESYFGQYTGKDGSTMDGISAISGATVTSTAVKNSVRLALDAFAEIAGEGGAAK